jgi:hypothetical protein
MPRASLAALMMQPINLSSLGGLGGLESLISVAIEQDLFEYNMCLVKVFWIWY